MAQNNEAVSQFYKPKKWYNKDVFPLIPVITTRQPNQYNTRSFYFKWLFFTFWTLDIFSFEVSFVASSHWGIGFIGVLPYLRWAVTVPIGDKIGFKIDKHLNRKPNNDSRR